MIHTVSLPGFENSTIAVDSNWLTGKRTLLIDGQSAPRGAKKGSFVLSRADGSPVSVEVKNSGFDPVPVIVMNGETIRLTRSLQVWEWLIAGFPLVLMLAGGAIGGAIGAAACLANVTLIRHDDYGPMRYVCAVLVSIVACIIWLLLVSMLRRAMGAQ